MEKFDTVIHDVDFCVVGGGIAGICAAVTAARHGVRTLLMHERPVLGGNASSEIRMWISGCSYYLETGLVEELRLENLYRNNYPNYSIWDSILYEKVKFQKNLTCLLNCTCQNVQMEDNKIKSVTGWQMTTEQYHEVHARFFSDCSGDGVLAPLTGAIYRIGREEKSEFGESLAQEKPDSLTMGMSCLIQARETNSPQKFIPPSWAYSYPDDSCFPHREHNLVGSRGQNFWWLELGGDQNSIRDTESIRDELLKTAFGLWDHMKNHGDHGVENWVIDWIGFLPGKRESRRLMGDYILSQKDVLEHPYFEDSVAYGGWPIDDHNPGGFRYDGPPNISIRPKQPYHIPARCLFSKNIENLLFAGRNISTSHTGLSSTRVMATCALLGQAVGTIVSFGNQYCEMPRQVVKLHIHEIQQTLLNDDATILEMKRDIPEISKNAVLSASSGNAEVLRDGFDRPQFGSPKEYGWCCSKGDYAEYCLSESKYVDHIRLVFDSNLTRSQNWLDHLNMISNYPKDMPHFSPPETLIRAFRIEADGKIIFSTDNNYQRLVNIPVCEKVKSVKIVIEEGNGKYLHSFDLHETNGYL